MWRLLHADLKHSGAYLNWLLGVTVSLSMSITSALGSTKTSRFGPNLVITVTFICIMLYRMKLTRSQKYSLLDAIHLPLSYAQLGLARLCYANIYWLICLVGVLASVSWDPADFQIPEWVFLPKLGCIVFSTHALMLISIDLKYILQNSRGRWANYLGTTLALLMAMVFSLIVMLPAIDAKTTATRFIQILQEPTLGLSGFVSLLACSVILSYLSIYTYSKRRSYLR